MTNLSGGENLNRLSIKALPEWAEQLEAVAVLARNNSHLLVAHHLEREAAQARSEYERSVKADPSLASDD